MQPQPEQIEVRIAPDGTVQIHVMGVKGEGCLAITQALELALGGQNPQHELTDEYFELPSEQERLHA